MSRELSGCSFESDQVKDMYRIFVTLLVEYMCLVNSLNWL